MQDVQTKGVVSASEQGFIPQGMTPNPNCSLLVGKPAFGLCLLHALS